MASVAWIHPPTSPSPPFSPWEMSDPWLSWNNISKVLGRSPEHRRVDCVIQVSYRHILVKKKSMHHGIKFQIFLCCGGKGEGCVSQSSWHLLENSRDTVSELSLSFQARLLICFHGPSAALLWETMMHANKAFGCADFLCWDVVTSDLSTRYTCFTPLRDGSASQKTCCYSEGIWVLVSIT